MLLQGYRIVYARITIDYKMNFTSPRDEKGPICSQNEAELLQLLQGLLTPAALHRDPAARAGHSVGAVRSLGAVLSPLPMHVDGEGPAIELPRPLLQNSRRGEEQEGPDGGEGPILEGPGARTRQTATALVLPLPQLLQSTCGRRDSMLKANSGHF